MLGEYPRQRCKIWIHNGEDPREEMERRQGLWWYLLLTGMGLSAVESLIGNRLSRHEKFL